MLVFSIILKILVFLIETREKLHDEFEKEVERIRQDNQERDEAWKQMKLRNLVRQGVVNDIYESATAPLKDNLQEPTTNESDQITSTVVVTTSSPPLLPVTNQSNSMVSTVVAPAPTATTTMTMDDTENDYIEPESPTGADAFIYDEDENASEHSSDDKDDVVFVEKKTLANNSNPSNKTT